MMMRILFLVLLCLPPLQAARLGFLPFTNLTKYKGNWFLEKDVPACMEKYMGKTYDMVSTDSMFTYLKSGNLSLYPNLPEQKRQAARHFDAEFLVGGDITAFQVSKRIIGEGKYGGLKTYEAAIKIKIRVYSQSRNAVIYDNDIIVEKKDNNTSVNLGRLSKDEALFDSLNTEKFGSKVFDETIAGAMMRDVNDKMMAVIQGLPVPVARKGENKKLIKTAKIVDMNDKDVFINAGMDDQVVAGDAYNVFAEGDTVRDPDTKEVLGISEKFLGTIEITEVKASHFSRARITQKKDSIRLMDRVRIEK